MPTLLALDFDLGPELEAALRRCVEVAQAFCVLDRRLSQSRRATELKILGATHVSDSTGTRALRGGAEVGDDIALVMLTSGSSGQPKAVQHTWGSLRSSAEITQASLHREGPPVWFPCLPANHIGGLAVLLRAILGDAQLLWDKSFDISSAALKGATLVSLVRAQLLRHDVSGFDAVLVGGARPPGRLPPNVIATWGMTETGSGVVYNSHPLRGVEVAAVHGQICVRTPTLFHSYRDAPRPQVTGPDGAGDWFPTGDGGEVRDGLVRVRGRLGFMINTGGEKLWPEDLESALATVAGVRDIAVTSRDDPEWGQLVVALVVSKDTALDRALRSTAEERIGPWAKPKEIRYVDVIPRTSNGKIRRDLIAQAVSRPTC